MSPQLRGAIEALPEDAWHPWKTETKGAIREWAEVPYVPSRQQEKKDTPLYRYLAIRIRRQQGALFENGEVVRHFAVVTNCWDWEGRTLLEWYREAGHGGACPPRAEKRACGRDLSQWEARS